MAILKKGAVKTAKTAKPLFGDKQIKGGQTLGASRFDARIAKNLQNNKTLRTTAIANAVTNSVKAAFGNNNNQNNISNAIKDWNNLVNGSSTEGTSQNSTTGSTNSDNNEKMYV